MGRRAEQAIAHIEDQDLLAQVPVVRCSSVAHRVHRVYRKIWLISTVLRMVLVESELGQCNLQTVGTDYLHY